MKSLVISCLLFFQAVNSYPAASSLVAPDAKLQLVAGEFSFTEGPACDNEGNVFFTDQPNDRILKWGIDGKLSTFLKPAGRANGLCFDSLGNLWACADARNELWSISPDAKITVVLRDFEGKLFNGPNDLWIHPGGGVFFTDPYYKRSYWNRGDKEMDECVYFLSPDHKQVKRVANDLRQPNGIIGSPDGKRLYVADIGAGKTYSYDINQDGSITGKRVFCEMGSDGMTVDEKHNIYLTGKGVHIFDPSGKKLEVIEVPEGWTANVCFGGKDRHTLFITALKGLYSIRMQVRGVGSQ